MECKGHTLEPLPAGPSINMQKAAALCSVALPEAVAAAPLPIPPLKFSRFKADFGCYSSSPCQHHVVAYDKDDKPYRLGLMSADLILELQAKHPGSTLDIIAHLRKTSVPNYIMLPGDDDDGF